MKTLRLSRFGFVVVFGLAIVSYVVTNRLQIHSDEAQDFKRGRVSSDIQNTARKQKVASVTSLLGKLEARLEDDPNDAKGWLLLARSYDHLGRSADANSAYEKAVSLGMSDVALAARLESSSQLQSELAIEIYARSDIADQDPGTRRLLIDE